jgi:hypothetical protein
MDIEKWQDVTRGKVFFSPTNFVGRSRWERHGRCRDDLLSAISLAGPRKDGPMPNLPDPLSRLPWFEELRSRAESALVDTLSLLVEFRATMGEMHHRWAQISPLAPQEEHGEQAVDPAGGKAVVNSEPGPTRGTS